MRCYQLFWGDTEGSVLRCWASLVMAKFPPRKHEVVKSSSNLDNDGGLAQD